MDDPRRPGPRPLRAERRRDRARRRRRRFLSADRAAATAPRTAGYLRRSRRRRAAHHPRRRLPPPRAVRDAAGDRHRRADHGGDLRGDDRKAHRPPARTTTWRPRPALYAAGAVLALSFACAVGLATRFIPLSLSLGAAGIVWVSLYRPVKLLSWLAVVVAGARLRRDRLRPALHAGRDRHAADPERPHPPPRPAGARDPLRRRDAPPPARDGIEAGILQTIGLVFAALFVTLEIRHLPANGGVLNAGSPAARRAERADARRARLLARPAAHRAADEEQGLRGRARSSPA